MMKSIGLDIGTTTICAVVTDTGSGRLLGSVTLPNDTAVKSGKAFERLQDPDRILDKCRMLLKGCADKYEDIACIGISAQMHGIVYVDGDGRAVSPYYTWQDERGNETDVSTGLTYAKELSGVTGYHMATGFGLTTHYYNVRNQLVPKEAAGLCNIGDYVGRHLTGEPGGVIHQSIAASLGLYDIRNKCFDKEAAVRAGLDKRLLPQVTSDNCIYGRTDDGIPVSLALGDNQASFLGSVGNDCRILLNVGTGGQLSAFSEKVINIDEIECRPYIGDTYLLAGSALCAGYAYSLVKRFAEGLLDSCGAKAERPLYDALNEAAAGAKNTKERLRVDTRFSGTRSNPSITGTVEGLTADTFDIGHLSLGVLEGICDELYSHYERLPGELKDAGFFVGSGNGIRLNPLLQEICCERFDMQLRIPASSEEAACGAALSAMLSSGIYDSLSDIRSLVKYE